MMKYLAIKAHLPSSLICVRLYESPIDDKKSLYDCDLNLVSPVPIIFVFFSFFIIFVVHLKLSVGSMLDQRLPPLVQH